MPDPIRFRGIWTGGEHGAGICLFISWFDTPGTGPKLHQHPYTETFVIRSGQARFTIAGSIVEASRGHILVVPAHTPHKFVSVGPDLLETTNIHESSSIITEWLE
jgi:mannose-6-phosphate isomerase-like protein (cupin superfamily)